VGGPPCQGFSFINNKRNEIENVNNESNNQQIDHFIESVNLIEPNFVIMEMF